MLFELPKEGDPLNIDMVLKNINMELKDTIMLDAPKEDQSSEQWKDVEMVDL